MNRILLALITLVIVGTILTTTHFKDSANRKTPPLTARTKSAERVSKISDRALKRSPRLTPEELLEIVYEQYPDLRLDYDIHDLPTESPLTGFTDWLAEHYPDGLDILPDELRHFRTDDFEWTPERLAISQQFFITHQHLFVQLFALSQSNPITTAPNLDLDATSAVFHLRRSADMLGLIQESSIAKGDPGSATDHFALAIAGLARHRLPSAVDTLVSYKLFEKSIETPGKSPLPLIPSFDQQTIETINAAKNELLFAAKIANNIPDSFMPFDEGTPEQRMAIEAIETNPEKLLLTLAAATQAQLDAYQAAAHQGKRPSKQQLDEIFTTIATERLGREQASLIGNGVVGSISQSQTRLALASDEAATQIALFEAAAAGEAITSLDQLVPKYLDQVPVNRETGENFRYNAESQALEIPTDLRDSKILRKHRKKTSS